MEIRRISNRFIGLVILAIALLMAAMVIVQKAENSLVELDVYGVVPEFSFAERSGQPFGNSDMMGKISVVNFFFTRCEGVCPRMNAEVADLYHSFENSQEVQFVSVTVDPTHDSLAVMDAYAKEWGVNDNRWVFLNTDDATVINFSEKGFFLPAENLPAGHSRKLALVDEEGQIRGYYDSFDSVAMKALKSHIISLSKSISSN